MGKLSKKNKANEDEEATPTFGDVVNVHKKLTLLNNLEKNMPISTNNFELFYGLKSENANHWILQFEIN
ncbi:hypothetical protein HERIO_718 [Hepatospora eriocheir]|uniref:Uncharacterized protein n=1 Tax=Hepatospora eriocheir TaxID=1081669 RepID=A0A1X0QCC4_9MICR|nr:hypothetical protein HERIO_718 [Hepatospora eriocheir]